MRTVCVCVLLAAVIVGGCASSKGESYSLVGFNFAELDKVAILEVTGQVRGETVKNQVGTFFEMELMKRGYSPIERSQVQVLLKEQEFQASDITSATGAAQAGKVLKVGRSNMKMIMFRARKRIRAHVACAMQVEAEGEASVRAAG